MLQLTELPENLSTTIDLTPEMLESTIANLLAAWLAMDKEAGVPGEPGTWTNTPAIEGPAWKVGARPMDGAITISLCPMKQGEQELWLTYALQRQQAEALVRVLGTALARPMHQGTA